MVGSNIVGDSGRGAEVGTDVGSEGRGAGDTILERENSEEVAEGAGEEEEAGDGGDGEETPATASEGEEHKAHSSYNRGNDKSTPCGAKQREIVENSRIECIRARAQASYRLLPKYCRQAAQ